MHLSSGARCRQGRRERKYRSPGPCPNRVDDISEAARRGAVKMAIARLGRDGHEIKLSSGPLIGHWLLSCFIAGHQGPFLPSGPLVETLNLRRKSSTNSCEIRRICDLSSRGLGALSLGLVPSPPWARAQLQVVRERTDQAGRRRGTRAAHGTITRWNAGCSCTKCRQRHSDTARARGRRMAQERLPKCGTSSSMQSTRGSLSVRWSATST